MFDLIGPILISVILFLMTVVIIVLLCLGVIIIFEAARDWIADCREYRGDGK